MSGCQGVIVSGQGVKVSRYQSARVAQLGEAWVFNHSVPAMPKVTKSLQQDLIQALTLALIQASFLSASF